MEPFTVAFLALLIFTSFSYSLEALLLALERGRPRDRRHVIHVLRTVVWVTATAVSVALATTLPSILLHQLGNISRLPQAPPGDIYVSKAQVQAPLKGLNEDGINPDIAGTGVRTVYFMQTLTLLVAEVAAMFHNRKAAVKEIGLSVILCKLFFAAHHLVS